MLHELKTVPWSFQRIMDRTKRFEIRKDDRHFMIGDILHLREFIPVGEDEDFPEKSSYSGQETFVRILFKTDFEQRPGFVVLSISDPI